MIYNVSFFKMLDMTDKYLVRQENYSVPDLAAAHPARRWSSDGA
jgi:hypothetical protein